MSAKKDYYEVLGLSKNATQDEIKKAYRKQAREHHPDVAADKSKAEEKFKEVNEAYQVLGDEEKKKMYDQFGHAGVNGSAGHGAQGGAGGNWGPFSYSYSTGNAGGQNPFGDFDPFDIFEDFFGFRGYSGQRRGKDLRYEIALTFYDALNGLEKEVNIESGKVKIKIPAGVRDGMEIRFQGKGMPAANKGPSGDLYLRVRVEMPREFNFVGSDIVISKEISFIDAILGNNIEIPVVDVKKPNGLGSTKLKIPAGTQSGTKFLLKGYGMPRVNSSGRDNILVYITVLIPQKLTKTQKTLLEQLKTEMGS